MTAATPGSAALLALASKYQDLINDGEFEGDETALHETEMCVRALRLAAKPDEDGVREALAELIALSPVGSFRTTPNWEKREALMSQLRALATTGHPNP